MPIPTYDQFIFPVLQLLQLHPEGMKKRDVHQALADSMHLSAEDRALRLPSGKQPVFENRIGWAHDRLKRAGLSRSVTRGVWQLTDAGRKFFASHTNGLDEATLKKLTVVSADSKVPLSEHAEPGSVDISAAVAPSSTQSPEERIGGAVQEMNAAIRRELLTTIAESSPEFFERLVLDVLQAMGYGASATDIQHLGGPGDGGFDGVIRLDALGLEKIYVQAKRYKSGNKVGPEQLHGFYGALAAKKARKGVFITSSSFTSAAQEFAASVSDSIVLVDGERLTQLMIEKEVGVSAKETVKISKIDWDYFEDA
jgi:restriction system protein